MTAEVEIIIILCNKELLKYQCRPNVKQPVQMKDPNYLADDPDNNPMFQTTEHEATATYLVLQ